MKKSLYIILTWAAGLSLNAQSDLTLYNFNAIPQSLHVNPAYPQQTKVWIGLPALSGIYVNFHNSGFALSDLLSADDETTNNLRSIANNLNAKSHLSVQEEMDLLGIGFKLGKTGFFTMGAVQKFDYKMDYPSDLIRFMIYEPNSGSAPSDGFSMNDFSYETMLTTNVYMGYQARIKDKLTIGGRIKYIIGQHHSWAERSNIEINTSDPFELKIKTDILVRTSGSAQFLDLDSNQQLDPMKAALPPNHGFGIDLGAHYKFNDKWSVSASVIDLGMIKWTSDTRDYVSKGEYSFEGIEWNFNNDEPFDTTMARMRDSISAALGIKEVNGGSYTHSLAERVFVGVDYHFNEKHAFGLLYHGKLWEGNLYHDYSVNYQGRWFRGMQFTASYSVINGTYNNVGAGVDFKLGPLQLYIISDNILGAILYENLQTTNLRLGLNLTFYGKKDQEVDEIIKDPLKEPVDPPFKPEPENN